MVKNIYLPLHRKTEITPSKTNKQNAKIAQLVEHNLAKVGVAGSSPVFRSKNIEYYLTGIFMSGWWNW